MMYIFRPGAGNVTDAARATISQPGAAAAAVQWWLGPWSGFPLAAAIDPANCAAAYRAVNTPGSPWGAGPANIAESYVNLNQPGTYDAAPGVAPAWAGATGWTFTGVFAGAEYLTTGIIPPFVALPMAWTILAQVANLAAFSELVGCTNFGVSANFGIIDDPAAVYYMQGNNVVVAPGIVAGNAGFSGSQGYRNGAIDGAPIAPLAAQTWNSLYIGARNTGGIDVFARAQIKAVAIYSMGLDAFQMAALGTAITGAMAQL